jgi:hypothetical protein
MLGEEGVVNQRPQVVIVGGGFGGLSAARASVAFLGRLHIPPEAAVKGLPTHAEQANRRIFRSKYRSSRAIIALSVPSLKPLPQKPLTMHARVTSSPKPDRRGHHESCVD